MPAVTPSGPPPTAAAKRVAYLGIGSLPGLLFCGLGAALAVLALVLAPKARREIEASGVALGGAELVRMAQICAVICLLVVTAVLVIGLAAAGVFLLSR